MTVPFYPKIPGKPITNLSPFVTDTLFPLAGGPFQINRSTGFSPLGPDNVAMTLAPLRPAQGDTGTVFYKEPTDHVLAHEVGHIIDHRNVAPMALANAELGRERYNHQLDYFGKSREEYVAEAFARAIESARHHFTDSTQAEKEMPGVLSLVHWLQQQKPFSK